MDVVYGGKKLKRLFIYLIIFLCTGCVGHLGKLSIISTKPFDFKKAYVKSEVPVMGKDELYEIIIFPIGTSRLDKAVENALNNEKALYLTDAEVKVTYWMVPFIYVNYRLEVTGNAWREAGDGELKKPFIPEPLGNL